MSMDFMGVTSERELLQAADALRAGEVLRARKACLAVLKRRPDICEAQVLMAAICVKLKDPSQAIVYLGRAVALMPSRVDLRNDLATLLHQSGRSTEAISIWQELVGTFTHDVHLRFSLAMAFLQAGKSEQAIEQLAVIAQSDPSAQNLVNLGAGLFKVGKKSAASQVLERAVLTDSCLAVAQYNLASCRRDLGDAEAAVGAYTSYLKLEPRWGARVDHATVLPIIYDSIEQISFWRERFEKGVENLLAEPIKIDDPTVETSFSDFYLAYQGLPDRNIKSKLVQMFRKASPRLNVVAKHIGQASRGSMRKRVGFLSAYFGDHPNGKMARGLIAKLDRNKFEVFVIFAGPIHDDAISRTIREHAEHTVVLDQGLSASMVQVAALRLDVLLFYDIGMNSFSYFLSFARLATTQCSVFGHPSTTGLDSIDHVITCDLWEPENAHEHYSEKMLKLTDVGLPAYFLREFDPAAYGVGKFDLGWPTSSKVYLCPQTAFKFHPDFDATIRRILELDTKAVFVCVETLEESWTKRLRMRFARTLGALADRVIFVPRQAMPGWVRLIRSADVVLEPPHFTGMISTLDVLATGTPAVTWEGPLARGRQAAGLYKKMRLTGCVAATQLECADLAVSIANSPQKRQHLSEMISSSVDCLFEDRGVISQLEAFLETSDE